jgi:hypothetical protein
LPVPRRIFISVFSRQDIVLAGLLVIVAVVVGVGVAAALAWSRSAGHRPENLGSVSQRWLSLHRTES